MIKGLEHLTYVVILKKTGLQPGEEEAQEDLTNGLKCAMGAWVNNTSQWCPPIGQEAMGTNMKHFHLNRRNHFSTVRLVNLLNQLSKQQAARVDRALSKRCIDLDYLQTPFPSLGILRVLCGRDERKATALSNTDSEFTVSCFLCTDQAFSEIKQFQCTSVVCIQLHSKVASCLLDLGKALLCRYKTMIPFSLHTFADTQASTSN